MRDIWRDCGMMFLFAGWCSVSSAQSLLEKNAKYVIAGTGIFGGHGLFTLSSADILPKGRFAAGGTYETGAAGRAAGTRYSLGFGLANRAEAFVVFSTPLAGTKDDLAQAALKFNVIRGDADDDFLGSVEFGYVQRDREIERVPASYRTLLARLHAGVPTGDVELFGNLGFAFQMGESVYRNQLLFGAGAFVPVISNVSLGAEISSDYSASAADSFGFGAGAKINAFDHFQIILAGRLRATGSRLAPTLMLSLSFSSAFYHVAPGRRQRLSRIPPLPTLEELQKEKEGPS